MLQVISISFQFAGALILLLWSFKAVGREHVKSRCFTKGAYIHRDDDGKGVLEKKRLQNASRDAILNVFAFCNLVIGYATAFWQSNNFEPCSALFYAIWVTMGILFVECGTALGISCLRFREDMVLTSEEIDGLNILTNLTPSEVRDICK